MTFNGIVWSPLNETAFSQIPAGTPFFARGDASIAGTGHSLSFFGAALSPKLTGVAVSAAGIHAALVTYGLIAA